MHRSHPRKSSFLSVVSECVSCSNSESVHIKATSKIQRCSLSEDTLFKFPNVNGSEGSKMHHNTRMVTNLLTMHKINPYFNITPSLTLENGTSHLHTLGTTSRYSLVIYTTNILQSKPVNPAKYLGLSEVNGELLESNKAIDKWESKRFKPVNNSEGSTFPSSSLLPIKWENCGQRGEQFRAYKGLFLVLFSWGWSTPLVHTLRSMGVRGWVGEGCCS